VESIEWELCLLLIDCLKNDVSAIETAHLSGFSKEQWHGFLALAKKQRVTPLLWHQLRQKGLDKAIPIEVVESLRKSSRHNTMNNLRFYGELNHLLSALKTEGIPLILLKGIFLADTVYESIGLREMNDIDVLAQPADLARIAEILMGMGYTPLQPICPDTILKTDHHLPGLVKKGHAYFEIHWNLSYPGEYYSIDPKGLWERAVPVHTCGCDALALSPEDLLLYLCLHTSYHHQFVFGLRPSWDIAKTIAHFDSAINWQILAEQAIQRGWQRGVYLSLKLAREQACANVPEDILERMRPDDITESVLEAARIQIFTDKQFADSIPAPFAKLLKSTRLSDKIRIFWQRIFLSRAEIASAYSVPIGSVNIYVCYLRRIVDTLRKHGHTLKKHQQKNIQLKSLVDRTNLIANWLARPQTVSHRKIHLNKH